LSSNTISKTDNTTDLQIPYTWSANYSVERSWFQLINSAGEMKNAGGAGAFTLGAGPTSRNLNFPAYLSTGTYTLKLCDVTTSSVSPTSICDTETLTVTSNVSNQEVSSQTASILESLKNLFNQWR
ncbi:MAG TPA: hypothetical protein VEC13_01295, partial [Candidatus Paceibacterota bacterium]|nr:hypothetical protein [Candidatus Paceibacterota bacterium]